MWTALFWISEFSFCDKLNIFSFLSQIGFVTTWDFFSFCHKLETWQNNIFYSFVIDFCGCWIIIKFLECWIRLWMRTGKGLDPRIVVLRTSFPMEAESNWAKRVKYKIPWQRSSTTRIDNDFRQSFQRRNHIFIQKTTLGKIILKYFPEFLCFGFFQFRNYAHKADEVCHVPDSQPFT